MINPEILQLGKELIEVLEKYADPREVPIKPDPVQDCKHEPSQYGQHGDFFVFMDVCEHCGVRLKAEKWVEA